jgi:glycosyltransferase involved in cell wall biosynthesis
MRVVQLGPYSPPHGGIQAHVVALREFLQEQGVVCDVIDLNRFRKTDGAGVYGPRNAAELFWLLLRIPADVLHLHIGGNLTTRLLALSLVCNWRPGRKSVLTFHSGGYPSSPEGQSASPQTIRGRILSQFDRVIGVNQDLVDVFTRYGLPAANVSLIQPHALPAGPPEIELPPSLSTFFSRHHPVLLSVGLLEPEYDLPLQVEVLGRLIDQFPQIGLIMIGSGSLEAELRQLIEEKSYGAHILLTGDVDRTVTLRVIADCDLFLRTTLFDGDSISLREALHFGVPVIATDRAPRPEGVCVIPAEDLEQLELHIRQILSEERVSQPKGVPDTRNLEAVLRLYQEMLAERK